MTVSGILYKGRPIEELSREELLECVLSLSQELHNSMERETHVLQVWEWADNARKSGKVEPFPKMKHA